MKMKNCPYSPNVRCSEVGAGKCEGCKNFTPKEEEVEVLDVD